MPAPVRTIAWTQSSVGAHEDLYRTPCSLMYTEAGPTLVFGFTCWGAVDKVICPLGVRSWLPESSIWGRLPGEWEELLQPDKGS